MSTIAAIATAIGSSGISIIRISGKESFDIIKKIFDNYEKLSPNSIIYGKIIKDKEILDNVLVSYFKAPNSFTGEDVCEINCHGGAYITKAILTCVIENGATLAMPGEFSKRAFLNGKIDLSEAESIIDLINSRTELEAKIATNKLEGSLFNEINNLRDAIVEILAMIEVSIDYPEYDYEDITNNELLDFLDKQINKLDKLILSYDIGKYIKEGVNVGIFGQPNVGKSSLLNCLLDEDRAIVTDIPGTTRDVVEETINIGNLILNISDTAGIRDTKNKIEKIGVDKSIKKIDQIDLAIYVLDNERKIENRDIKILSKIKNKGIKIIGVINKVDTEEKSKFDMFLSQIDKTGVEKLIEISALNKNGIDILKNTIENVFLKNEINNYKENIIVSERQKILLKESIEDLKNVKKEIINNIPVDIVQIKLKHSADKLGEIIGNNISEDVVNKIFSKFCLGK